MDKSRIGCAGIVLLTVLVSVGLAWALAGSVGSAAAMAALIVGLAVSVWCFTILQGKWRQFGGTKGNLGRILLAVFVTPIAAVAVMYYEKLAKPLEIVAAACTATVGTLAVIGLSLLIERRELRSQVTGSDPDGEDEVSRKDAGASN